MEAALLDQAEKPWQATIILQKVAEGRLKHCPHRLIPALPVTGPMAEKERTAFC